MAKRCPYCGSCYTESNTGTRVAETVFRTAAGIGLSIFGHPKIGGMLVGGPNTKKYTCKNCKKDFD